MNQELLTYLQRELEFLATDAVQFARQNPETAGLVDPAAGAPPDPHVERFIDGFALINADLQLRLDGLLPDVADALLNTMFPHVQRPLPSMGIVSLQPQEPRGPGFVVPAGTELIADRHQGVTCRFRTCYPVTVSSLRVQSAILSKPKPSTPGLSSFADAASVLHLALDVPAGHPPSPQPAIPELRLFLHGGNQTTFPLYELLVGHSLGVVWASAENCVEHAGRRLIEGAGFSRSETAIPWPARSSDASRVLTEFFHFPQKFLFIDIPGRDATCGSDAISAEQRAADADAGGSRRVDLFVFFDSFPKSLESQITADTFQPGCTPFVNVFEQRAEPIRLTHDSSEYRITGDLRAGDGVEILSIDRVTAVADDREVRLREFFAPAVDGLEASAASGPFWRSRRQQESDAASSLWMSVADPDAQLMEPETWVLDLKTTCLNGDRPAQLPYRGNGPSLRLSEVDEMCAQRVVAQRVVAQRVVAQCVVAQCVVAPCGRRSPRLSGDSRWCLSSLLALNYLPLIDQHVRHRRLRETLVLHNLHDSPENLAMIHGLSRAGQQDAVEQIWVNNARVYCQGTVVTIQVDDTQYPGNSSFLFCRVIAEFLARSCSFNSFCRLEVESIEDGGVSCSFPAASGEQVLQAVS